ncbi:MAG: hypothetical protein ACN6OP_03320 [Pseudomonadales bacterium]
MRCLLIALSIVLCPLSSVSAQTSVYVGSSGVSIGINLPAYPALVPVPGYPVYYAPQLKSNYFFYDGLYWVYQGDNWYASSWYNGPWQLVGRYDVPLFVLRIPIRYYRRPPAYFRGRDPGAPPRWGEHWGRDWEDRRSGWDQWDHRTAPPSARLPDYQRQYSGVRYPRATEQQNAIRSENYHYQPRETVTQQHYQQQGNAGSFRVQPQPQAPVQQRSSTQQDHSQPNPQPQQVQPPLPRPRQPVQQMPPSETVHSVQPPPQMQRPQPGPQDTMQRAQQHGSADIARPEPQQEAPGQRLPTQQQHSQPNQQRQQQPAQSQTGQAVQQMPPAQPTHQTHSAQPPSQMQHPQSGPQDKHGENRNEEHGPNGR